MREELLTSIIEKESIESKLDELGKILTLTYQQASNYFNIIIVAGYASYLAALRYWKKFYQRYQL